MQRRFSRECLFIIRRKLKITGFFDIFSRHRHPSFLDILEVRFFGFFVRWMPDEIFIFDKHARCIFYDDQRTIPFSETFGPWISACEDTSCHCVKLNILQKKSLSLLGLRDASGIGYPTGKSSRVIGVHPCDTSRKYAFRAVVNGSPEYTSSIST